MTGKVNNYVRKLLIEGFPKVNRFVIRFLRQAESCEPRKIFFDIDIASPTLKLRTITTSQL